MLSDIDIYIAELEAELFKAPCPYDDYAIFNGCRYQSDNKIIQSRHFCHFTPPGSQMCSID
eukprot:scaffold1042_cov55-Cyclotella_meneghiniana.AAC.2